MCCRYPHSLVSTSHPYEYITLFYLSMRPSLFFVCPHILYTHQIHTATARNGSLYVDSKSNKSNSSNSSNGNNDNNGSEVRGAATSVVGDGDGDGDGDDTTMRRESEDLGLDAQSSPKARKSSQ